MIRANYLAEPRDLQRMLAGVRIARTIVAARAFSGCRGVELCPGPEAKDDKGLLAHIKKYTQTLYHPAGTCKMGNDEAAVVDAELRAREVDGLRVVDASVMPLVPGGNTNAPTIMIAEKAADMIKRGTRRAERKEPVLTAK